MAGLLDLFNNPDPSIAYGLMGLGQSLQGRDSTGSMAAMMRQRAMAEEEQRRQALTQQLFGGGDVNDPNGTAKGGGGLVSQMGLNPAQVQLLRAAGPEQALSILGERAFAQPAGPQSSLGKLVADYRAGRVPEDVFRAEVERIRRGNSPTVNVNTGNQMPQVGTIPQGYQLQQVDGAWQMAPIPGSEPDVERKQAAAAAANAQRAKTEQGDIVLQDIGRALNLAEGSTIPTTGLIGDTMRGIGGTPAHDLQELLGTVQANIGFDRLQAMREASPTGGALGNVTERELARLEAVKGSLAQSQSREQLVANLKRLQETYLDVVHGAGNWSLGADGRVQTRGAKGAAPAVSDLSDDDLKRMLGL